MFRVTVVFLISIIAFNIYSQLFDVDAWMKILGHSLLMPLIVILYGIERNWHFGPIDGLIFLVGIIGSVCDSIIFFGFNEKGEFFQIFTSFFVHLILIIVFRREGAYIFNIQRINILKVIIPVFISFFFFGFVLINVLPAIIYFAAILYSVQLTILTILGFYRPVKNTSYWCVSIGVTVMILKDILYSYFFYVYLGTKSELYVPLYLSNAIAYFLIVYGIALNQNQKGQNFEKISTQAIINSFKELYKNLEGNSLLNFSRLILK